MYLPSGICLVIVGGRILTQAGLMLITRLLATVLLYLYTMSYIQTAEFAVDEVSGGFHINFY